MADINLKSTAQTAGIPAQWEQNIATDEQALITGSEPAVMTEDLVLAAGVSFAALTPLMFDENDLLVPVTAGETPVAIALIGVTNAAEGTGMPTYRAGCFNPKALAWPEGFEAEADQIAAFRGAPTPTNIILRRPKTYSV